MVSGLTGIAISQANIWSQPSRAIDDLADYEKEFPAVQATNKVDWQLTPIAGGLSLTIRFLATSKWPFEAHRLTSTHQRGGMPCSLTSPLPVD